MAKIKAFKGWRPVKEKVHLVASRPYDVLNTEAIINLKITIPEEKINENFKERDAEIEKMISLIKK